MRRPARAVSRADVAAAAGVAPATVSLVLNRHPGISIPESTRRRITEAAERLGYRPNQVARALSSGRTHTVGVVIHFLSTPFQLYTAGVLNGAWGTIEPRHYRMLIDEGSREHTAADLFHEKCADGLLVLAPPFDVADGELGAAARAGFPAVLVGASLPGDPFDYVDVDNAGAAGLVVAALVDLGHRAIAHITGPVEQNSAARDRLAGYRAALRAAGRRVDPRLVVPGDYRVDSGREAVAELLRRGVAFTAVFAANDGMACGAVEALRAAGRRVPDDVSVVGVDGFSEHPLPGTTLASVRQPLEAIGRAAGECLLARLAGDAGFAARPRRVLLPGELMRGDTIGPAPRR